MSNFGQEIRAVLPECGDCINCKLIVWSKDADKKELRNSDSVGNGNDKKYFTVRCNWLKSVIQQPTHLEKCEGKKPYNSEDL